MGINQAVHMETADVFEMAEAEDNNEDRRWFGFTVKETADMIDEMAQWAETQMPVNTKSLHYNWSSVK
jgi:hypothetical protein